MSLLTRVITRLVTFVRNLLLRTEESPAPEEKLLLNESPEPSNSSLPKPKGPVELYEEKWQRRRKPQK